MIRPSKKCDNYCEITYPALFTTTSGQKDILPDLVQYLVKIAVITILTII